MVAFLFENDMSTTRTNDYQAYMQAAFELAVRNAQKEKEAANAHLQITKTRVVSPLTTTQEDSGGA